MTLRAHTSDGAKVELTSFDGKQFSLISTRAYAPGQPMPLTVELTPPLTLDLKSLGSKLREDQRFDVRARAQTLPKGTRDRLVAALDGG
jgi:hypothetical protein